MTAKHNSARRDFIKKTAILAGGVGVAGNSALGIPGRTMPVQNPLPKWKGFNLLDFFSPNPGRGYRKTSEEDFKWMSGWGFDFVRIPMAYPSYLEFNRRKDITPDEVYQVSEKALEQVDKLVFMAHKYKMHVSLNLHRAPGYCINAGFHEPYNLWKDEAAQQAFYWHWSMWATRYKQVSRDKISFDLLNEPAMIDDMNNQHAQKLKVPGDVYAKVAEKAARTIWEQNPDHLVIADGNEVGSRVIPEISTSAHCTELQRLLSTYNLAL